MADGALSAERPLRGRGGEDRDLAIDYLRAVVIVLVVFLHSALAYTSFSAFDPADWRAASAPVVDPVRWPLLDSFVGYLDTFFMALMFFISGSLAVPSLRRRGSRGFFVFRLKRLGIPFLIGIFLLAPAAFYPSFLMADPKPPEAYLSTFFFADGWPVGPPWFLWVLLFFDGAAALAYRLAPKTLLGLRPPRPAVVVLASVAGFLPLGLFLSHYEWASFGPFDLQPVRLGQYFAFFLLGMASGNGPKRERYGGRGTWIAWLAAGFLLFASYWAVDGYAKGGFAGLAVKCVLFPTGTALSCLGLLGAFRKLARKRLPVLDDLSSNAFGIYLVHYGVVLWMQYALLPAPWPAWAKFIVVFTLALATAWGLTRVARPAGQALMRKNSEPAENGADGTEAAGPPKTWTLYAAVAAVWLIFTISSGGTFASPRNLSNLFRQTAVLALVAMGLQFVIVVGKIDFIGGVLAGFVSLFATSNQGRLLGRVLPRLFAGSGASQDFIGAAATAITVLCCLAVGALVGLYQGWLIGVRKLPSLPVSFANTFILAGLMPLATLGGISAGVHKSFVFLGQGYFSQWAGWIVGLVFIGAFGAVLLHGRKRRESYDLPRIPFSVDALKFAAAAVLVVGSIAYIADGYRGLPVPVLLLLAAVGILSHLMNGTRFGAECLAVGYNPSVASFSGVNVKAQILKAYALSGLMAGAGGVVLTGYMSYGTFGGSLSLSYSALTACLIGLVGLGKDRGAVVGAAIGALMLESLDNWMVLTDVVPFLKEVIRGGLLVAVAFVATRKGTGLRFVID